VERCTGCSPGHGRQGRKAPEGASLILAGTSITITEASFMAALFTPTHPPNKELDENAIQGTDGHRIVAIKRFDAAILCEGQFFAVRETPAEVLSGDALKGDGT